MNACTIDVEDYFQVSAFEQVIERSAWGTFDSRVVANTHRVLDTLSREGVSATFFVLGWIAENEPKLIREISDAGHEIGCHSFEHRLIYELTPEQFREDLRRSRGALEDIVGEPVIAYRAPSFSITARSMFALDILVQEGFCYDSSIFPIHHDRYGIPNAPIDPYVIRTPSGPITEFPPTVVQLFGMNFPVAGGGYFRLYPYALTSYCVRNINRDGRAVNLYLHPWEFDPKQPRIKQAPLLSRFRHYVNLQTTARKLSRLLQDSKFDKMSNVIEARKAAMPSMQALEGGFERVYHDEAHPLKPRSRLVSRQRVEMRD